MINVSQLSLPFNDFVPVPEKAIRDRELSSGAKIALVGLLSFRNRQTGQCNPKLAKLAERIGTSPRTARRWVRRLQNAGKVEAVRHRSASSYTVLEEGISAVPKSLKVAALNAKSGRASAATIGRESGPLSLYEPEELNLNAPAPLPPSQMAAAAAAISPPAMVKTTPTPRHGEKSGAVPEDSRKKTGRYPEDSPTSGPVVRENRTTQDSVREAEEIAYELLRSHPQPGMVDKAVEIIAERMARGAASAASLRQSHAQWCKWWAVSPAGTFIPMLWRWVASNDWRTPPADVAIEQAARKQPQRATTVGTPEWSAALREAERGEILIYMRGGSTDAWFHKEGYSRTLTAECRALVTAEEEAEAAEEANCA